MNVARDEHEPTDAGFSVADAWLRGKLWQFAPVRLGQRGLERIDVNSLACYHESAAPGFKRARASTRFP